LFSSQPEESHAEDWSLSEKLAAQIEILGIGVEAHPLEPFHDGLRVANVVPTLHAIAHIGKMIRIAGVRQSIHRSRTSTGEWMAFISIEDQEGMLDLVVFPGAYRRYRNVLSSLAPFIAEGVVELDEARSEPYLRVERVELLN
jgi:DNA polymerase-3 subunit alpha